MLTMTFLGVGSAFAKRNFNSNALFEFWEKPWSGDVPTVPAFEVRSLVTDANPGQARQLRANPHAPVIAADTRGVVGAVVRVDQVGHPVRRPFHCGDFVHRASQVVPDGGRGVEQDDAVIGGLGRLVIPGKQKIGFWLTLLIGIVAALIGTFIANAIGMGNTLSFQIFGTCGDCRRGRRETGKRNGALEKVIDAN